MPVSQQDEVNYPAVQRAFPISTAVSLVGELSAPDEKIVGLTGATAGARFVGGTTSGSPQSGTFLAGDYVVDQTGGMYVCIAAGSPGSWVPVGAGFELGYAERTTTFTVTATTPTYDPVTGLTVTATTGSRPVKVIVNIPLIIGTAGTYCNVVVRRDGTTIGQQAMQIGTATAGGGTYEVRENPIPSAGSHTWQVAAWRSGAAATINANTAGGDGTFYKPSLHVVTC